MSKVKLEQLGMVSRIAGFVLIISGVLYINLAMNTKYFASWIAILFIIGGGVTSVISTVVNVMLTKRPDKD